MIAFVISTGDATLGFERAQSLPPPEQSMAVNPLTSGTDDVMAYKFKRGGITYLLSWTHSRTYEVYLEKISDGKWIVCFQSTTMGKPRLRQTNEKLELFLHQPYFQIGEEEPKAGHDFYEVMTVDSTGVTGKIVQLPSIKD